MIQDKSATSVSYLQAIKQIKIKYQKELGDILDEINNTVAERFSKVLGEDYLNLLFEKKSLSEDYKKLIGEAFECAGSSCGQDYIDNIVHYAERQDIDEDQKNEKLKELMRDFLALIKPDYPVLVDEISFVKNKIERIDVKINQAIQNNASDLNTIKKEILLKYSSVLQEKIKEYRSEMNKARERFGVEKQHKKIDDSTHINDPDEFFIKLDDVNNILN